MSKSSKRINIFWIVGLCAFVSLMCSGFAWLLGVMGAKIGFLSTLSWIAHLILVIMAVVAGWFWVSDWKNKTARIVFQVLFVIFGILAFCGAYGVHF